MPRSPITKAHPYTPQSGQFAGRTFETDRAYHNALSRSKGFANWHAEQRAAKKVTAKSFEGLRPSQKQARARALDALSKMRKGAPLGRAAKEAGTTPNTVRRYVGEQLHRERGRVVASKSDRLFRHMWATTTEGQLWLDVRSSRQASLIGQHRNAVKNFLRSGDETPLRRFAGVKIGGKELEVRPEVLEELGRTTAPEFEGPQSG